MSNRELQTEIVVHTPLENAQATEILLTLLKRYTRRTVRLYQTRTDLERLIITKGIPRSAVAKIMYSSGACCGLHRRDFRHLSRRLLGSSIEEERLE
jgi:hypothetical protein